MIYRAAMEYINTLYPTAKEEDFTLIAESEDVKIYEHPTLGKVAVGPGVGDEGPATFDEDKIREWFASLEPDEPERNQRRAERSQP